MYTSRRVGNLTLTYSMRPPPRDTTAHGEKNNHAGGRGGPGAARLGRRGLRSVRREAVEQPGAARGHQVLLAAAARAVRGVPGLHVPRVLLQPHAVVVADDRRALAAFRPVAAGGVAAGGRVHAGRIRARENVVLVGLFAAALDDLALLGERGLLAEVVLR